MTTRISWPEGKTFAFTIFDDTDRSTVENTKPVYDFLKANGLRTTKSVWPIAGTSRAWAFCSAPTEVLQSVWVSARLPGCVRHRGPLQTDEAGQ